MATFPFPSGATLELPRNAKMDAASLPPLPPNDITTEATPNELEISSTSKLLLVQGIHQLGNGDWDAVSDLINSHPLHGEQKGTFTPRVGFASFPSGEGRELMDSTAEMRGIIRGTEQGPRDRFVSPASRFGEMNSFPFFRNRSDEIYPPQCTYLSCRSS